MGGVLEQPSENEAAVVGWKLLVTLKTTTASPDSA